MFWSGIYANGRLIKALHAHSESAIIAKTIKFLSLQKLLGLVVRYEKQGIIPCDILTA